MARPSAFHGEVDGGTAGETLSITAVFGQAVILVGVLAVRMQGGGPAREDAAVFLQVSVSGELLLGVVIIEKEEQ